MNSLFYRMKSPDYESDREDDARNPVTSVSPFTVPGIVCERCGKWGSSNRIRMALSADLKGHFNHSTFLPREEWNANRERWAALLGVSQDRLMPGTEVGHPAGILYGRADEDVIHPFPGQILVQKHVAEAVEAATLTGVELWEARLVPAPPNESRSCATTDDVLLPQAHAAPIDLEQEIVRTHLWELCVTGQAWRVGSTRESLMQCDLCGRLTFPNPKSLAVDLARWDGSDFFNVDVNPNIVIVTSRVRDLFEDRGFSNCTFIPL